MASGENIKVRSCRMQRPVDVACNCLLFITLPMANMFRWRSCNCLPNSCILLRVA